MHTHIVGNHTGYMDGFEIDITDAFRSLRQRTRRAAVPTRGGGGDGPAGDAPAASLRVTARVNGACADAVLKPLPGCGCLSGCFDSIDIGRWSGIWGNVTLVRRGSLALDQLTVRMQPLGKDHGSATIVVTGTLGNGATAVDHPLLETPGTTLEVRITEHRTGRLVRVESVPAAAALVDQALLRRQRTPGVTTAPANLRLQLNISNPRLWSPASPSLYHAHLRLLSAPNRHNSSKILASAHARFGLREVAIDGQYFMLNGNRHFMVGTGDDFAYPTEAPPMNASLYRARLSLMKQFGFDFVRLHSHFEAPGFFEAADEVGMIVSPALPAGGCHDVLLRTWEWQINALRNTPSVIDVNMANEAYGVPPVTHGGPAPLGGWPEGLFPWRAEFYAKAKALNPLLHVIDTDGCCWAETQPHKSAVQELADMGAICPAPYANGSCDRATNDFMTPSFGITTPLVYPSMFDMRANNVPCIGPTCAPPKPVIAHELGNFGAFVDLPKEIAGMLPTNVNVAQREGFLQGFLKAGVTNATLARWVAVSKGHAYFSWKATVEFLRVQPTIAGCNDFDIILDHFPRVFQLHLTPHALRAAFYLVPSLTSC